MAFESTLPGRYFYDPEIYAHEQERLFGQMWTCFGRADALSAAGDFKTVELAGENVLIVRGRGRTARLPQCLSPPHGPPLPVRWSEGDGAGNQPP
jgi:hypothetical protein